MFNMITGTNELKTLIKHLSCKFKCKFDSEKCNSKQKWNSDKCRCQCKNPKKYRVCVKDYIWNSATCICEYGKYLASIINDSVITCDEVIEKTKTVPTNLYQENATCKVSIFYLLFY